MAIIAVIATPIILGVINDSKYKAFKISLNNVEHAYELYAVQKNIKPGTEINIEDLPLDSKNLKGKVFLNEEGKIELKEVTDGTYSAEGTLDDLSVLKGTVDELVKNKLKIDVNLNSTSTSIIVTVNRIEGYPTSYSYEITGPDDYSKSVKDVSDNTYTFDKLRIDKEYAIKVTAKNKIGLTKEVTKVIKTLKTESSIDIKLDQQTKYIKDDSTLTITYDIKEEGLVGKYKWDDEEEFTIVEEDINPETNEIKTTLKVKTGTLIARIYYEEKEIVTREMTINNIDDIEPTVTDIKATGYMRGNTITGKFSDDKGLSGYAITSNNSCDGTAPTKFTNISGTSYELKKNVSGVSGNAYIWIKDIAGNTQCFTKKLYTVFSNFSDSEQCSIKDTDSIDSNGVITMSITSTCDSNIPGDDVAWINFLTIGSDSKSATYTISEVNKASDVSYNGFYIYSDSGDTKYVSSPGTYTSYNSGALLWRCGNVGTTTSTTKITKIVVDGITIYDGGFKTY